MRPALHTLAFAVGVYLSIRGIAALYGVLDLWYAIGREYPKLAARILAWATATLGLAWLLPAPYQATFGWGLLAFAAFYLSLFGVRYPALWALRRLGPERQPGAQARFTSSSSDRAARAS